MGRLPGGVSPAHWAAFALLWALGVGLIVLARYPELLAGAQIDADSYMRLVRVERLAETWGWFDARIARSNWPHGEVLHWTRPVDVLIIALAVPFAPFLGAEGALRTAGSLFSPVLNLSACLALVWAVAPLTSMRVRALAAPALLVQPIFLAYGLPGRADHHALIGLLAVLALGWGLRWLRDPTRERAALATGVACALGIWVSPEFLVPLALFFAAGTALWIRTGAAGVAPNLALTLGLSLGLTAALALERPPSDWLTVEYDRLSVAHWSMALLALGFWLAVAAAAWSSAQASAWARAAGTPARRTAFATAGALLAGVLLHLIHPDFFRGPWTTVDPRVQALWLEHVHELRPLWPDSWRQIGLLVAGLGWGAATIPFLAARAWRRRTGPDALPLAYLAAASLLFSLLTLGAVRWGLHAGVVLAAGIVLVLDPLLAQANVRFQGARRRAVRLGLVAALIPGVLFAGYVLDALLAAPDEQELAVTEAVAECRVARIAHLLNDPDLVGGRIVTVLAHVDRGPEILLETRHRVLSGPYHRNAQGILDVHLVFTEPPDAAPILQILREREVRLVLLCPPADRAFLGTGQEGSTFHRLVHGPLPEWGREVHDPALEQAGFRLFLVENGR